MPEGELNWDYPDDRVLESGQEAEYPCQEEEIEEIYGFGDCSGIGEDYRIWRRWCFRL